MQKERYRRNVNKGIKIKYKKPTLEKSREYSLKSKYDITLDQYNKLHQKQKGLCAICGTDKPKGRHNRFHVDHCHVTGKVRGLLCSKCNLALGSFNDDKNILTQAIKYLDNPI